MQAQGRGRQGRVRRIPIDEQVRTDLRIDRGAIVFELPEERFRLFGCPNDDRATGPRAFERVLEQILDHPFEMSGISRNYRDATTQWGLL
jgi:hypothetical protein